MAKSKAQNRRSKGSNMRKRNTSKPWIKDAEKGNYQDAAFAKKDARRAVAPVETNSYDNDPSWYIPNGQLAKDVASFPFDVANGVPLPKTNLKLQVSDASTQVSGIMVFDIVHTMGWSQTNIDPLNYAANQLYVAVQAANSRTPLVEVADQAIITHCIAEAYAFYMYCVRAYGIMQNYDILDRFTPQILMSAMRLDYDDFKMKMADFRAWINQMALKLATLYLPTGIDYVNRRVFLYESIYRDSNSRKAQYYMFNPAGFYAYVEGDPANPTSYASFVELTTTNSSGLLTLSDLKTLEETLINPLIASEDVMNVAANYLKAFGESNIYSVNPISETFKIVPVYNPEVLSQMENAYVCTFESARWLFNGKITHDPSINGGAIMTSYSFESKSGAPGNSGVTNDRTNLWSTKDINPLSSLTPQYVVINKHDENVSPESVLVATRLSAPPTVTDVQHLADTTTIVSLMTKQTEIVRSAMVYFNTRAANGSIDPTSTRFATLFNMSDVPASVGLVNVYNAIMHIPSFDWHPQFMLYMSDNVIGEQEYQYLSPRGFDFDNFTTIALDDLDQMNEVAEYGLFMPRNLPGVIGTKSSF